MVELQLLTAAQTRPLFDQLVDIYQAAFSQAPYYETLPDFLNFIGRLSYHARHEGFRCVIARPAPGQAVVGFGYGFPGRPGSWLYDLVYPRLAPDLRDRYLSDFFEFAELAVLPDRQGQGLGGRLHDTLLAGLNFHSACLATPEVDTRARRLYQHRAWIPLLGGFDLPGSSLKFEIMGKELK
jgi:GNAT superfamily N-acetyltransferase